MKKGGGSESTIIIGPSKCVLVYALHSLEYVLGVPCPISGIRAKIIYYTNRIIAFVFAFTKSSNLLDLLYKDLFYF